MGTTTTEEPDLSSASASPRVRISATEGRPPGSRTGLGTAASACATVDARIELSPNSAEAAAKALAPCPTIPMSRSPKILKRSRHGFIVMCRVDHRARLETESTTVAKRKIDDQDFSRPRGARVAFVLHLSYVHSFLPSADPETETSSSHRTLKINWPSPPFENSAGRAPIMEEGSPSTQSRRTMVTEMARLGVFFDRTKI